MEEMLSTRVRFGPFELDLKSGELRKGSRTLLLQEQPLRVLQMIVERGGELATRQEIQKKLWPNDTVVDFDHGINTAIKKIRQTLGDSADNPRYIQTVARRGYRLLVPVEWVSTPSQLDQKETDDQSAKASPSTGDLRGKKVSHYRVLEILGGGGMGVVYKAEDLKLGRTVAMKFLPEELGDDPKAKERFEREARAASALDHPNICSIYEFGEYEGQPFIVMQFLAGQNLRDLLAGSRNDRGYPFRVDELLDLAIQIVSGLGAAHEKGIIHRDIKPANIFITNRGQAKVLDFGVAKMLDVGESVESTHANSSASGGPPGETPASWSVHLTRTGVALGTEGYMSPEQIRAESLDARTDLFSVGLVLYEMAAGQRAFTGHTAAELHEAILHQAPVPPRELNPAIPPEVEAIIRRCLEKERERRYQSAEELIGALAGLRDAAPNGRTSQPANGDRGAGADVSRLQSSANVAMVPREATAAGAAQAKPHTLRRWWLLAAAVFVAGLASLIWYLHRPLPPPRISGYAQLTRDGRRRWLTGVDESRLYINSFSGGPIYQVGINGGEMVPVPVAVPGISAMGADVSPDGSSLLVTSNEKGKPAGTLWNVRIPDGSYRRLGYALDATFSPDRSTVVYSTPEGDIWLVRSDGTGGHKLGSAGGRAVWPFLSPDGRVIRFSRGNRIWEISSNGSNLHEVLPGWHGTDPICCGQWTLDGKLYLFSAGAGSGVLHAGSEIWALDERRGPLRQRRAGPVQLATGPIEWDPPWPSRDGKKVFAYGSTLRGELTRIDPATKALKPFLGGISADNVTFSKDGQFVVYVSYPDGILWRANRDGSKPLQLTDPPMKARVPRWSPDGSQIAFMDCSSERCIAFTVPSVDGIPKRILPDDNGNQTDPNWSADGNKIVLCQGGGFGNSIDSKNVLSILDISSHQVTQVPGSDGTFAPRWSPDGRFIAAITINGERALRVFDVGAQRWLELPVVEGVGWPSFSRDSRYIYFERSDESDPEVVRIFRIPVKGGATELIADLRDWRFIGAAGIWMGLDPTDAPLLMRDAGSKDIYALTLEEK